MQIPVRIEWRYSPTTEPYAEQDTVSIDDVLAMVRRKLLARACEIRIVVLPISD